MGADVGASALRPGATLDGKYEIVSLLGVGGMGEVYKVRHLHLNAFRCIKVMRAGLLSDESYRTRFLREARLATQIHHPNVAVVHDFAILDDRTNYMVTEYIDGTTVRQWAAAHGRFPPSLAAEVATQVLAGLDHIHRRGLLHRDISADNVMLSFDNDDRLVVKIIDLGVAKDTANVSDQTMSGMLVGNPKYMSPEQLGELEDGEQLDGRADLYCLGVVLYEMLIGVPPFASKTPSGYIIKHLTQPPPPFREAKPDVEEWPDGLEAAVFRALEKDRRRRYPDARAFSRALQSYLAQETGTITRDEALQLHSGASVRTQVQRFPWADTVEEPLPQATPPPPPAPPPPARDGRRTEEKAHDFELALLESVRLKEQQRRRDELQRLAEGHPPQTPVGKAAREALARLKRIEESEREEEAAFQRAWEEGSSAAWRRYVDTHPRSPRAAAARELLDEATAFEAACSAETETGLREYSRKWPEGRHRLEAQIRLSEVKQREAERAFARAVEEDTYAAFRDFLARHESSPRANEARTALAERMAFETAAALDSEVAWDEYLGKWSHDRHAPQARARFEAIRSQEDDAFRAASDAKTSAAWKRFLERHPDGRRSGRAKAHLREAAAFEQARVRGRGALEEFLRANEDGLLARDARRLLRAIGDEDDYQQALAINTVASWQLYLATHPSGTYHEEVRARLTALEDAMFFEVLASKDAGRAREFLAQFPHSPRRDEMQRVIESWDEAAVIRTALEAIERGDSEAAAACLPKIQDDEQRGEVVRELSALRERLVWEEAEQTGSTATLREYLHGWPNGRWATQARKKLERAANANAETEAHAFDEAWERGTPAAWETFLAAHPDGTRADEARQCLREASEFEMAKQLNTPTMWRAFVKAWPDGRHRLDAQLQLKSSRG